MIINLDDTNNSEMKNLPDALLILDQDDIAHLNLDNQGIKLLTNSRLGVIPFSQTSNHRITEYLRHRGFMKRDAFLIRDPFDLDDFEEISLAQKNFAIRKYMYFSAFCNLLGAKEVTIKRVDSSKQSGEAKFSININTPKSLGIKSGIDENWIKSIQSSIALHDVFEGGQPQIEKAESLLKEHCLFGDPTMRSLLEISRMSGSAIKSRELALNLSTEAKSALKIVGKLNLPASIVQNFGPEYNRFLQEQIEFNLVVEVKF